VYNKGF